MAITPSATYRLPYPAPALLKMVASNLFRPNTRHQSLTVEKPSGTFCTVIIHDRRLIFLRHDIEYPKGLKAPIRIARVSAFSETLNPHTRRQTACRHT